MEFIIVVAIGATLGSISAISGVVGATLLYKTKKKVSELREKLTIIESQTKPVVNNEPIPTPSSDAGYEKVKPKTNYYN